jgi:hypothetical protein
MLDYDIGVPVPSTPDACFGDFDWFLTHIRFARLLSKMYEMLFSVSATLNSADAYRSAIELVKQELSHWRDSIVEPFRPGLPFRYRHLCGPSSMQIAIRLQFYYYSAIIAIARLDLSVNSLRQNESGQSENKRTLMASARAIIELTKYIDTEAYTPIW